MSEIVQSFQLTLPIINPLLILTEEEINTVSEFNRLKKQSLDSYIKKVEFEKNPFDITDQTTRKTYQNIIKEYEISVLKHHSIIPKYSAIEFKVWNYFRVFSYSPDAHIRFINFCSEINRNNQELIELYLQIQRISSDIELLEPQDFEFSKKSTQFNDQREYFKTKLIECLSRKIQYDEAYRIHINYLIDNKI